MRFTVFCAAALAASPAFASVSTTTTVESTTSTELQTTATGLTKATSAHLSRTIATSASNDDSSAATTAPTTSAAETTDLEVSIATTTTTEATTTEAAFEPIPTFDVVGKGAQVDGQYLLGYQSAGFFVGWQYPSTNYRLTFSIDPTTNSPIDVNGNILCIQYGTDGDASLLRTCSNNMLNQPDYASVTCEQTRDQELDCSVPAKTCTLEFDTLQITCTMLTGTFDNFYTYSGRQDGTFLAMAGATNPGANYQAVVLGITPNESK
ncbi:pyruvate decarboxylase [Fusarium agapanthi]|uniref:Pyruvate decarboxylase n=1 Tax=Fusarium agapanthi TaxID=1803897 RepID=A0A9P5EC44_9HYPO|nr:pyruvate decarboxylase [Fusarium agapanthi]